MASDSDWRDRRSERSVIWSTPLGTKGCAGSLTTGGRRPGTGSKNGPPPLRPTHPARFDEKSGGGAFCCAAAGAIGAAPMRPLRMLPARTLALQVNQDISCSSLKASPSRTEARRLMRSPGSHAAQNLPQVHGSGGVLAGGGRLTAGGTTNKTWHLKQACEGKDVCDYRVDCQTLGDPAAGCAASARVAAKTKDAAGENPCAASVTATVILACWPLRSHLGRLLIGGFNDIGSYELFCLVTLRQEIFPSRRVVPSLCLLKGVPLCDGHSLRGWRPL